MSGFFQCLLYKGAKDCDTSGQEEPQLCSWQFWSMFFNTFHFMPEGRIQLFNFIFSVSFSQILNQISYGFTKLHFVWLKKEISPWVWSEDIQQHKTCCLFVMASPKDPGKTLKEIWHNLNIIQAIERNVMRFIPYYLKNSFDVSFSTFSCEDMGRRQHLSSTQTILRWRWLSCLQVCLRCMLPSHLQLLLQHFACYWNVIHLRQNMAVKIFYQHDIFQLSVSCDT